MSDSNQARVFKTRRNSAFSLFFIVLLAALLFCLFLLPGQSQFAFAAELPTEESEAAETQDLVPESEETGPADPADAEETIIEAVEDQDGQAEPVEEPVAEAAEGPEMTPAVEAAEPEVTESPVEQAPEEEAAPTAEEAEEAQADTTPPVVKYAAAAVKLGKVVTPSTFVMHYEDESSVTLRFTEKPDTSTIGEYPVTIVAEDAFGNSTVIETTLYVCDRVIELELENRMYTGLQLREKVGTLHGYHPSIETFKVKKEGASSFELKKGDKVIYVGMQIRDTTRPKAKAVDQVCYLGYPKGPEAFVTDVSDFQDFTIEFLTEPDWDLAGTREVKIAVTDASYNRRIVKAMVDFKKDDIPPELILNISPYHYVGDAVAYMKGVSALDNLDPNCEIAVDKSQVKYRKVGTYPVTYTATDRDGNSASVTVEISFREPSISDEQLDELADSILHDILKDKMSVAQKIKAIYDFCRYKIRYTGDSDKTDWKGEAYRGLTEFKGDCFTYYSAAFLLLNKIDGVEVMSVERIGGRTHHYWCLVNIGSGWYHYDACPNHIYGTCFMRTNNQLHNGEGKVYWKYDMSQFPDVATKSFKMS